MLMRANGISTDKVIKSYNYEYADKVPYNCFVGVFLLFYDS